VPRGRDTARGNGFQQPSPPPLHSWPPCADVGDAGGGGGAVLLLPLVAAPPDRVPVGPQAAPRVQGTLRHRRHLRAPAGALPVQHRARQRGSAAGGGTSHRGGLVELPGHSQHHDQPQRVCGARPAVAPLSRRAPPPVPGEGGGGGGGGVHVCAHDAPTQSRSTLACWVCWIGCTARTWTSTRASCGHLRLKTARCLTLPSSRPETSNPWPVGRWMAVAVTARNRCDVWDEMTAAL